MQQFSAIGLKEKRIFMLKALSFELEHELSELLLSYKEKISCVAGIEKQLKSFGDLQQHIKETQESEFELLKARYENEMIEFSLLESRRKNLMKLLETKGEGQVCIQVAAYPATTLQIKNQKNMFNH